MAKKKSFTASDNPALSFISQETIDRVDRTDTPAEPEEQSPVLPTVRKKPPEGYKYNTELIETKSRRVQSLILPSVYNDAKALSSELGISLNDFINKAIAEATYNNYVTDLIKLEIEREK